MRKQATWIFMFIFLIALANAQLGYNNPQLPSIDRPENRLQVNFNSSINQSELDRFVPYIGAIKNADMGSFNWTMSSLIATYIENTPIFPTGSRYWNNAMFGFGNKSQCPDVEMFINGANFFIRKGVCAQAQLNNITIQNVDLKVMQNISSSMIWSGNLCYANSTNSSGGLCGGNSTLNYNQTIPETDPRWTANYTTWQTCSSGNYSTFNGVNFTCANDQIGSGTGGEPNYNGNFSDINLLSVQQVITASDNFTNGALFNTNSSLSFGNITKNYNITFDGTRGRIKGSEVRGLNGDQWGWFATDPTSTSGYIFSDVRDIGSQGKYMTIVMRHNPQIGVSGAAKVLDFAAIEENGNFGSTPAKIGMGANYSSTTKEQEFVGVTAYDIFGEKFYGNMNLNITGFACDWGGLNNFAVTSKNYTWTCFKFKDTAFSILNTTNATMNIRGFDIDYTQNNFINNLTVTDDFKSSKVCYANGSQCQGTGATSLTNVALLNATYVPQQFNGSNIFASNFTVTYPNLENGTIINLTNSATGGGSILMVARATGQVPGGALQQVGDLEFWDGINFFHFLRYTPNTRTITLFNDTNITGNLDVGLDAHARNLCYTNGSGCNVSSIPQLLVNVNFSQSNNNSINISIPSIYPYYLVHMYFTTDAVGADPIIYMRFNNDSAANYYYGGVRQNATLSVLTSTATGAGIPVASATAGQPIKVGEAQVTIQNTYGGGFSRTISANGGYGGTYLSTTGSWVNYTADLSNINLYISNQTVKYIAGSNVKVWGASTPF